MIWGVYHLLKDSVLSSQCILSKMAHLLDLDRLPQCSASLSACGWWHIWWDHRYHGHMPTAHLLCYIMIMRLLVQYNFMWDPMFMDQTLSKPLVSGWSTAGQKGKCIFGIGIKHCVEKPISLDLLQIPFLFWDPHNDGNLMGHPCKWVESIFPVCCFQILKQPLGALFFLGSGKCKTKWSAPSRRECSSLLQTICLKIALMLWAPEFFKSLTPTLWNACINLY